MEIHTRSDLGLWLKKVEEINKMEEFILPTSHQQERFTKDTLEHVPSSYD